MESTGKRKRRWGKGQGANSAVKVGRPRKQNLANRFRQRKVSIDPTAQSNREVTVEDDSDWEGEAPVPLLDNAEVLFPHHQPTVAPSSANVANHQSSMAAETATRSSQHPSRSRSSTVQENKPSTSQMYPTAFSSDEEMAESLTINPFRFSRTCCNNCRRKQMAVLEELPQYYQVKVRKISVPKPKFLKKFSNLKWTELVKATEDAEGARAAKKIREKESIGLYLCANCEFHFLKDEKSGSNKSRVVWPAMLWNWLTNEELLKEKGIWLWKLVPTLWRPWWIDELKKTVPAYHAVMLHWPHPAFKDVTIDRQDMEEAILDGTLPELVRACNEHMPKFVKCPWGCTDHHYKCGHVELDVILTRLLGASIKTCTPGIRKTLGKVVGIERDLLDPIKRIFLLRNPEWEIQPAVAFNSENDDLVLLSCSKHQNGSKCRYLHPPRNPNGTLPSPIPDQLTSVVTRPRTIKSVKAHHFSNSYQMHHMAGQYNGVDTVRVCTNHDFQTRSAIARKHESLAIKGRRDIKGLLDDWCEDCKLLPPEIGSTMLQDADQDFNDEEILKQHCDGATYITFADALKLHRMNKTCQGRTLYCQKKDEASGSITWTCQRYIPPWPTSIVHVHPCDSHGCDHPVIPTMRDDLFDCRLTWYLVAMHVCLSTLWEASDNVVEKDDDWSGWLLSYATKTCYPERKRAVNSSQSLSSYQFQFNKNTRKAGDLLYQLQLRLGLRRVENGAPSQANTNSESDSEWEDEDCDESECSFEITEDDDSSENDEDSSVTNNSPTSEAQSTESQLHTDGVYHCEDIETLFQNHKSVSAAHYSQHTNVFSTVQDAVNCIILHRDNNADGQLQESIPLSRKCHQGHEWDLRFVGCTHANGTDQTIFYRHGGQAFTGWWKQENGLRYVMPERVHGHITAQTTLNWDVAIYVKLSTVSLEKCRDQFLESMGSQTVARCQEHDIPLVVSPYKSPRKCTLLCKSGSVCTETKPAFQCPVEGCSSAICRMHHNSLPTIQGEYCYVGTNPGHAEATDMDIENSDDESLHSIMVSEEQEASLNSNISMAVDDSDDVSLHRSVDTNNRNDFAVVTNPIDFGNANDDAGGEDAQWRENEFPVTSNLEPPVQIRGEPNAISGSTILNNMGSLLVRQNDKLKGSKNQQFFLQRLVLTTPGRSIPLLYPEGMLFPSIFWKDSVDDGSVIGAIPSGLLAHDTTLKKHGIASIQSHVQSRITNTSIPTSSSVPYLCHAFDKMINLGCRHEDVRVVLHRGVTGTKDGVRVKGSDKSFFDTDNVDSRPIVNRLAAAVAERQATYFFTHTANMLDHFGLAPIKRWIDSDEAVDMYCKGTETFLERQEIKDALQQEAAVTFLRIWMEVAVLYMNYITYSKECPLGSVDKIWWRFEFQDSVGNLPHIHALIWLKKDPPPSQRETEERIRGSIMSLIEPEEIDELVAEGLLSCLGEEVHVQELARRVLKHVCSSRCKRRIGMEDNALQCRVTRNAQESPDRLVHSTKEINVDHTPEAQAIMEEIGLFVRDNKTGNLVPVIENLKATKHFPPSDPSDGVISACNGRLFVATRSNQNLKIATGYLASRYLAKYLALVDENNRVYVGAVAKDKNSLKLDKEFLHNTKITGSAIQEAKRDAARRDRNHPTGRAISHMEMICVILGYDQVYTNFSFVHIPTVPLEERPALDRKRPLQKLKDEGVLPASARPCGPDDLDAGEIIPTYRVRNEEKAKKLPLWRKFSRVESLILRDQCLSPHTMDAITVFSIRPPELRFVAQPKLYFRWFHRATKKHSKFIDTLKNARLCIQKHLQDTSWIDGSDCRIYVRPDAIPEILTYLTTGGQDQSKRSDETFYPMEVDVPLDPGGLPKESPFDQTLSLFQMLNDNMKTPPRSNTDKKKKWDSMRNRLIGPAGNGRLADLPIIWYNSVKPVQANRWLIHILLSMGEFDNEMNLLCNGNIKHSFVRAKLLQHDPATHKSGVNELLKRYIQEQLIYLPGGTKSFDRHVANASRNLKDALLYDQLTMDGIPPALYTHLVKVTDDKANKHIKDRRRQLAQTTIDSLREKQILQKLPGSVDEVVHATRNNPIVWHPLLAESEAQCGASRKEQVATLQNISNKLTQYQLAQEKQTKNLVIVGGPGNGKTTVLQTGVLMSLAQGFNTGLTANMSERAQQLGCEHISRIFCIPVNQRASPCRLAELAISRLLRNPIRLSYLRKLDVLFIDELGQISAELLSILDIILRRIRNSPAYMGGILVISTMDAAQLPPVNGRPPLLSPHMLTCYSFCELKHSVRAGLDKNLRRMQLIARTPAREMNRELIEEFKKLVMENCTFVRGWDDKRIKPGMLQMFGKKTPGRLAEERLLRAVRQQYGNNVLYSEAVDYESTTEGDWQKASKAVSRDLSRRIKQPYNLAFYEKALYETTYNYRNHFSQAQMAILLEMPTVEDIKELKPVKVMVAPHGCKYIPDNLETKADFLKAGFKEQRVGVAPERPENLSFGIMAKRQQYGLRHRVASTIHAGMGQDLAGVVTKVDSEDPDYKLWEKEQVVVLMSRTHFANQIVFVGDKQKTANALADLIMKRSQYSDYMDYLLTQLLPHNENSSSPKTVNDFLIDNTRHYPFLPKDTPLPSDSSGYAYIIGSTAEGASGIITYIGEAENLCKRLVEHNSRRGPDNTADLSIGKWALIGYICGFEGCSRSGRLCIERIWQEEKEERNKRLQATGRKKLTADEVADLAPELIKKGLWKKSIELADKNLIFVRCGRFSKFPIVNQNN